MTFTVSQYLAILINLCIFIGFLFAMKFNTKRNTDRVEKVEKAIFKDTGGLLIVDNMVCAERMKSADARMDREAAVVRQAFKNIDCLNQNVIKLMIHNGIDPIVMGSSVDDKLNG